MSRRRGDPILGQHPRPHPRTPIKHTPSTPATATRRQRADHPPATQHQAPTLWRKTPRRSRKGDAGQGARAGHATTQPSASRHAHLIEHTKSQLHRHRRRPLGRPTPRPPVTATTSNTRKASSIDTDDGQHDDLDLGQQPRPRHRTLLWNTPSTTATPIPSTTTNHPTASPDTVA